MPNRIHNGAPSELAHASYELWIRELLFTVHNTPICISVYATDGVADGLQKTGIARLELE